MIYEYFISIKWEYFISFTMAFIVAFCATPMVRKFAKKIGAVDIPKDARRMHQKPIPRLGGLAIVLGFVVGIIFNNIGYNLELMGIPFDRHTVGILLGVMLIVAIGFIDDIYALGAKLKLSVQILAALTIVFVSGIRIISITNPFAQDGVTDLNIYVSYALTIMWIVGITNAINLIDGLDGLAAGVASISALSLFFVSIINEDYFAAMLTAILAGATLGFLPFNYNPAKIFMGDTGSTFLGFILAVISIHGTLKSYAAISIVIPVLILGLPLFDTAFAILRRILKGKSIMEADRGHLHHRLIDMGLSHRQSVVVMYTASATLGLSAIALADKGVLSAIILIIFVAIFIIGGARYMTEITKEDDEEEIIIENEGYYEETKGNYSVWNASGVDKDGTTGKGS